MASPENPVLVRFGIIPDELSAALVDDFALVDAAELPPGRNRGYTVAVTTSMTGAGLAAFERFPDLKLIACNGAGLDKFDLAAAERRGIEICNTPDAVTTDTADFAIAMIFAARRRVVAGDRFVRAGTWRTRRPAPTDRVTGCRVGIIGIGRIGTAIARRAAALDMRVSYNARSARPALPYEFVASVPDLAAASDVLIAACPECRETHHLISRIVLEQLGQNGILINISRGSVVDETALIEALAARRIGAAALDVFDDEPNINPAFFAFDNVILSPHAAAVTAEARGDMAQTLLTRIRRFFAEA